MSTRIYKLCHANNADGSAIAQLDIRKNGKITGVQGYLSAKCGAADDRLEDELSFSPASQIGTNDAIGQIVCWQVGGAPVNQRSFVQFDVGGLNIPVGPGTRLYVHQSAEGSPTAAACAVFVRVEE